MAFPDNLPRTGAVGGDGLTTQELHQVRRYISQGKGELVGSAVVGQAATSSKPHAVVSEAGSLTLCPHVTPQCPSSGCYALHLISELPRR